MFKKPYDCNETCKFTTGWHYFLETSASSELDKFGAGMVLYFRFLKYITIFFFIFALLSIPSLYYTGKGSENWESKVVDLIKISK